MTELDRETLKKLCKLCRIEASEEELVRLQSDLPKILDYIKRLDEIDTESVAACSHVLGTLATPLREDEPGELLDRKQFLDNSPSHTAGMVRVPPVIKQST